MSVLNKLFRKKKPKDDNLDIQIENYSSKDVFSPLNGSLIPLNTVNDPIFAQGMVGSGVAIKPSDGKLYSPIKGRIKSLFPTQHAIGIVSEENNNEILIHIGINTVELEGELFESLVDVEESVVPGQLLIKFDEKKILEKGYDNVTMVIFTNIKDKDKISNIEFGEVKAGEKILYM